MQKMTLMQHFSELRRRVIWTFAVFALAVILGWYVAPYIQEFLTAPLLRIWPNGTMLYSGMSDGLMIRFSLAMVVGLIFVIPFGFYQIWRFVSPGLHKNERNFIWPVLIMSPILFCLGAAFAFYVMFPFVFGFFLELNQQTPVPTIFIPNARDYLGFAIGLFRVFGIAFQLPLVLVLMNRLGVLSRSRVVRARRYAIVLVAIMAAVLTPPDIVSQIALGLPMWALFEISILFMRRDTDR